MKVSCVIVEPLDPVSIDLLLPRAPGEVLGQYRRQQGARDANAGNEEGREIGTHIHILPQHVPAGASPPINFRWQVVPYRSSGRRCLVFCGLVL